MFKTVKRMILHPKDSWFEWHMFWKNHKFAIVAVAACLLLAAP